MSEQFKKSYNVKLPKSKSETEEFGPGKTGLEICSTCGAVYYKKHWHRNLESLNFPDITNAVKKDASIKFILCPACAMVKNHQYEGRVVIKNAPAEKAAKLEELIESFCRRANGIDPMHRLIGIKKSENIWEVTLTENQLANKLSKKIKDVFHSVKTRTHFAPEPSDVAEAVVEFDNI